VIELDSSSDRRGLQLDLLPQDAAAHPDDWSPFDADAFEHPEPPKTAVIPETVAAPVSAGLPANDIDAWFDAETLPAPVADPLADFPVDVPEPMLPKAIPVLPAFDPAKRLALLRASRMIDRFDIAERRRREEARLRLAAMFERFPAGASVAAIGRAIDRGASIGDLEGMAEIRTVWFEDPSLWLVRSHSRAHGWTVRDASRAAASAMTWRLADRLLRIGSTDILVDRLCVTWRDDWLGLRPKDFIESGRLHPAFYSYPAYLAYRSSLVDAEVWADARPDLEDEEDDGRIARRGAGLLAAGAFPEMRDRTQLGTLIWTSAALQPSCPPPRGAVATAQRAAS
jgi:hypothetical protein